MRINNRKNNFPEMSRNKQMGLLPSEFSYAWQTRKERNKFKTIL